MNVKKELQSCLEALQQGQLSPDRLTAVIAALPDEVVSKHQSLLYIQARATSLDAEIHGYTLYVDGQIRHGPENPDDWPYKSVAEAIRDGWRVISFPNLALMMDDRHTYGLGCEFILEKLGNGT